MCVRVVVLVVVLLIVVVARWSCPSGGCLVGEVCVDVVVIVVVVVIEGNRDSRSG